MAKRRCLHWITLLALPLLLGGCLGSGDSQRPAARAETPKMVWPRPPAPARIEFVSEITRAEDLGISPGFWGSLIDWFAGAEEVRLIRPTAVAMAPGEVLLVADPGAQAVHRFDVGNKRYTVIRGSEEMPFRSPVGLTVSADGKVYVTDSALDRIFVIDRDSEYAVPFDTAADLAQPTGIAWDDGRLYVVSTRRHEVLVLAPDGALRFRFARRGTGDGELNYPTMIWADAASHDIWVTDSLNFRVQRFERNGRFVSVFGKAGDGTGDMSRPKGVATDRAGHVYVLDALFGSMQIFTPDGELLLHVGQQGRGKGQFWLPTGIFVDDRNRIFVADSFNRRIQVFRYLADKG